MDHHEESASDCPPPQELRSITTATATGFNKLPAELRSRIWGYAIQTENLELGGNFRVVELYNYNHSSRCISVRISQSYPRLFAVNREARYESSKIDGGEWIRVKVVARGEEEKEEEISRNRRGDFEIYFNYEHHFLFLSERFMPIDARQLWTDFRVTPEQARLGALLNVFDSRDVWKFQRIMLTSTKPHNARYFEFKSWWRGEGIAELFNPGVLKDVILVTGSRKFANWVMLEVVFTLGEMWEKNGVDQSQIPYVYACEIAGDYPVEWMGHQEMVCPPFTEDGDPGFTAMGIHKTDHRIQEDADTGATENAGVSSA